MGAALQGDLRGIAIFARKVCWAKICNEKVNYDVQTFDLGFKISCRKKLVSCTLQFLEEQTKCCSNETRSKKYHRHFIEQAVMFGNSKFVEK